MAKTAKKAPKKTKSASKTTKSVKVRAEKKTPAKKAAAKPAKKKAVKASAPKKAKAEKPKPTVKQRVKKAVEKVVAKVTAKKPVASKKEEKKSAKPQKPPKVVKSAKATKAEKKAQEELDLEDAEEVVEVKPQAPVAPVILTDAEGRPLCRVKDCDQHSVVETYCRYHYLLFWKKIQNRKKILSEGKLEQYIEELTSRYPLKFLELIRKDLSSEPDFFSAIQELDIDEGNNIDEYEDENFMEEVRGIGSSETERVDDEY